ncbi:MAG: hypothetical protein L6Q37_12230, partial [Bdellovibrionaceae bacterium]|nr:hypothetical protein [Pseudobdellovibrionaceae bacterium]
QQHVGCTSLMDYNFCEKETTYSFSSSAVNWEVNKDELQGKIASIVSEVVKIEGVTVFDVFIWVNDFNSLQVIKIQGWNAEKNFLISVPLEFKNWNSRDSVSLRKMNSMPYPIDYGITLGELIFICKTACEQKHIDLINSDGKIKVSLLTGDILSAEVPWWEEEMVLKKIQNVPEFTAWFTEGSLSPVIEANGYSQLAFRFVKEVLKPAHR